MMCKEIENRLPAYQENLLSPEEKKSVEGHFNSCPHCSQIFAELKKANELVQELEEVEPPPFFEQRIMSRVREEAGQKRGLLEKFFYPLHIKIPIQVFATIVVAVLAFHVYRTGEPEIKQMAPLPIPLTEVGKGQEAAESPKAPELSSAVIPARRAGARDFPEKNQQHFVAPPVKNGAEAVRVADSGGPTGEEGLSAMKPEALVATARDKDVPSVRAEVTGKSREAVRPEQKRKAEVADTAAAAGENRKITSAATIQRSVVELTIQAGDMDVAIREVEERLSQVNARIIERQRRDGSELLKAEMAAQHVPAFLDRLKGIGRVHLEKSPLAVPGGTYDRYHKNRQESVNKVTLIWETHFQSVPDKFLHEKPER